LKKNYFSSHKLPKQQSTSFWCQGILGVKKSDVIITREEEVMLLASFEASLTHGYGCNYMMGYFFYCNFSIRGQDELRATTIL
jgi:hypothetical protein